MLVQLITLEEGKSSVAERAALKRFIEARGGDLEVHTFPSAPGYRGSSDATHDKTGLTRQRIKVGIWNATRFCLNQMIERG